MKNLLVFALLLVIALPFASAGLQADDIHLDKIRLGDYGYVSGQDMESYVYVFNENSYYDALDGTVSVRFMDDNVGAYGVSSQFDVRPETGVGNQINTPLDNVAPGEYLVQVRYQNNDFHKTKYTYVVVG